jgi:mRNA deadenylase 3'-5' endonuclease subunit Ccr4
VTKKPRNPTYKSLLKKRPYTTGGGPQRVSPEELDVQARGGGLNRVVTGQEQDAATGSVQRRLGWKDVPGTTKTHGTFKVTSLNVLADSFTEPSPGRVVTRKPFVAGRVDLIMKDLERIGSDIFCLQEVEWGLYKTHYRPFFLSHGYEVDYCVSPRANDVLTPEDWRPRIPGLLTAWRPAKFTLMSFTNYELRQLLFEHPAKWGVERKTMQSLLKLDNPISIAVFETTHVRQARKQLCVANIHTYGGGESAKPSVNVLQTQLALHGLRKMMYQQLGMNPKKVDFDAPAPMPTIFAGDFNARPGSGSHELLSTGFLSASSSWLANSAVRQATSIDMRHFLQLSSAYGSSPFGEPPHTHYSSANMNGVLDYIWYTPSSLHIHRLLETPDFTGRNDIKLPTVDYPSDHLPIGAEFSFDPSPLVQQHQQQLQRRATQTVEQNHQDRLDEIAQTSSQPTYVHADFLTKVNEAQEKLTASMPKTKKKDPLDIDDEDEIGRSDFKPKKRKTDSTRSKRR